MSKISKEKQSILTLTVLVRRATQVTQIYLMYEGEMQFLDYFKILNLVQYAPSLKYKQIK